MAGVPHDISVADSRRAASIHPLALSGRLGAGISRHSPLEIQNSSPAATRSALLFNPRLLMEAGWLLVLLDSKVADDLAKGSQETHTLDAQLVAVEQSVLEYLLRSLQAQTPLRMR
jgi:hypothetical protein